MWCVAHYSLLLILSGARHAASSQHPRSIFAAPSQLQVTDCLSAIRHGPVPDASQCVQTTIHGLLRLHAASLPARAFLHPAVLAAPLQLMSLAACCPTAYPQSIAALVRLAAMLHQFASVCTVTTGCPAATCYDTATAIPSRCPDIPGTLSTK